MDETLVCRPIVQLSLHGIAHGLDKAYVVGGTETIGCRCPSILLVLLLN